MCTSCNQYIDVAASILWLGYAFSSRFLQMSSDKILIAGVIIIGASIVGFVIGWLMYRKTQHQYQEIIDQIEELKAE